MDHLILNYAPDTRIVNAYASEYNRKLSNYQLYNNQINQSDFERECNPLGIEVGQFQDAIQPYNKTYNKIQVLLGEESRRPFNFKAILVNSEGVKSKLAYKDTLLREYLNQQIQSVIASISEAYPQGQEPQQVMDPATIDRYMKTSYLESREILASKILNYLLKQQSIQDKKNDAFKHALISGEEFVYVGVDQKEPYVEVLNPLGVFYHKSAETKWIQDGLYAGYRTYMTSAEVLDKFGQYMTAEEAKKIDSMIEGHVSFEDNLIGPDMRYGHDDYDYDMFSSPTVEGSYGEANVEDWLVQHVEWVSQKKVGFLTFSNEFGEPQTDIVSEDFMVPPTASKLSVTKAYNTKATYYTWLDENQNQFMLEWQWIPEVWSGVRIGQDIYVMVGPKPHQFRSLDNPFVVKLGYHGLVYNAMNASPVSLMDRMKPFQYLYFIVMHKLKRLIAQDQGKVFHFDTTMVDPSLGIEKTLYYLKEMNIDFYNSMQNADMPGQNQRGKVTTSTDMSNMQFILNYINVLNALDLQISEVAGVNRQREGQVGPTEAVSNAQANIQMSSIITEVYFQAHNKLWESVLSSLVQVTQHAWKGRYVVKQHVLDDLSISTLLVNPDDLENVEIGVFVVSSGNEVEMFNALKGIPDVLLNSHLTTFSDLITLYSATSAEELKAEIRASEERALKQQSEQQQQQLQAQQQMQQEQQEFELEKQQRQFEHEVLLHQIDSFRFQKDQDVNDNQVPDQLEIEKFRADVALKSRKLDIEEDKLEAQKEKNKADAAAKRASKSK